MKTNYFTFYKINKTYGGYEAISINTLNYTYTKFNSRYCVNSSYGLMAELKTLKELKEFEKKLQWKDYEYLDQDEFFKRYKNS